MDPPWAARMAATPGTGVPNWPDLYMRARLIHYVEGLAGIWERLSPAGRDGIIEEEPGPGPPRGEPPDPRKE